MRKEIDWKAEWGPHYGCFGTVLTDENCLWLTANNLRISDSFIYLLVVFGWAGPLSLCGLLSGCRAQASHCGGFSCCGSQTPEHRLSSWLSWAKLLLGLWDRPGSGIEPVSPALAGWFFTTEPPEKPQFKNFKLKNYMVLDILERLVWVWDTLNILRWVPVFARSTS